ncbi:MAG: hypothetical protein J6T52_13645 [Bacteroidaceae bacterium]|nr:hypothetical protein [Bacteroidaceae bacterium]
MKKKTYIVPECTIEIATNQNVCEQGYEAGTTSGDGGDGWAKKRNDINTYENDEKEWGEVEKNIW